MTRPLQIGFEPGGLDPKIASALDDLIVALQTWAGTLSADLTVTGPLSGVQPRCRYFLTATQAIPSGVSTPLAWGPIGQDYADPSPIDGLSFDNGLRYGKPFLRLTGDTFLVPPLPGQYLAIGSVEIQASAAGSRILFWSQRGLNGVEFPLSTRVDGGVPNAALSTRLQAVTLVTVRDPALWGFQDALRLNVFQDSGGPLNALNGFASTYAELIKVS
jgi:hypothetical protein